MDGKHDFLAIVVGAGVAGLVTSHILQKAKIPHVVLEKRSEVAPPQGASIAIYPHGARILYQLGIYEQVKQACEPCKWWYSRDPSGKVITQNGFFGHVRRNHGHDILLLERRELLQILYDSLPDKSYIKLGTPVKDIVEQVNGIEVVLGDGHKIQGDIVIGADGAYSRVREVMWTQANSRLGRPMRFTASEKKTMKTSWKCVIGMAPGVPEMGERDMTVVHNTKYSFLILTQPSKTFFFVFFRLEKPFTWPGRLNHTDAERDRLVASVADHPISDNLVFGELWKRRIRGELISLEEGVLQHWHHGRIVLAGDAAHKVTPNIALGGNTSMESTVVLCNLIRNMLEEQRGNKPSRARIQKVFDDYQKERIPRVQKIMELSSFITKLQAWDTPLMKFVATWIMPYQSDRAIADQLGDVIKTAPKLNWIPTTGFRTGCLEWADSAFPRNNKITASPGGFPYTVGAVIVSIMMYFILFI